MRRDDLRQIAKETVSAIEMGTYHDYNGIICELPSWDFLAVEIFSPEALDAIEHDEDDFFERSFYGSGGAHFYLVDSDS